MAQHGVIPIRGMTPPSPMPVVRESIAASTPRARRVPVEQRPWHVLLVPPTPGARTRAFDVARWQARMMLSALVMLLLIAAGAVTAVIVALDHPDLLASSADVATLRGRLTAVEDSLALARAVLAESAGPPPDVSVSPRAPVMNAPGAPGATGAPLLPRARAHTSSVSPERAAASAPRIIEGLPVIGAIVSGFSSARRHPILHIIRPHLGIDIAAKRGTRVAAPAAGRVTYVGRKFALGLTVDIMHAGGITTRYAHLRTALVHEGERVERGAWIATVGSSGLTTGPHLHYEVSVNGRPVDPLRFRMPQLGDSAVASGARSSSPLPGVGLPAAHEEPASPVAP